MGIKSYSTTPASNTSLFPENQSPSSLNDGARQIQADVRAWYEYAQWIDLGDTPSRASATTFKITGDVTAQYEVDRRIKCFDAATSYGTIATSSYSAPDTTIGLTLDSGSLTASLTSVALSILTPTNQSIPPVLPIVNSLTVSGTSTLSGDAIFKSTLQTIDGSFTIVGSSDATKKVRFEVDGNTTGTTRIITVADRDFDMRPVLFRVHMSGAQTITNLTDSVLNFDTEDADPQGYFNTSTYKLTPLRGWYKIKVCVWITGVVDTGWVRALILKNDTVVSRGDNQQPTGGNVTAGNQTSDLIWLSGSDYVQGGISISQSGNKNTVPTSSLTYMYGYRLIGMSSET